VVGPRAKREAVRVVREEARLSEQHACGVMDTSLPGLRVVRVLDSLRERRGTPGAIQVDNVLTVEFLCT
jgi:hypothetical protein